MSCLVFMYVRYLRLFHAFAQWCHKLNGCKNDFRTTKLTPLGFGQMSLSLQGKFAPYFTLLLTLPGKLICQLVNCLSVLACWLLYTHFTARYLKKTEVWRKFKLIWKNENSWYILGMMIWRCNWSIHALQTTNEDLA